VRRRRVATDVDRTTETELCRLDADAITYVHGSRLKDWLEWQPASVSAQSVENARSCLRRLGADALRDAA